MVALVTLLFAPVLAAGQVFGLPVVGAIAPVGMSVAAGAFVFGIGMQLGGGCGSGTLQIKQSKGCAPAQSGEQSKGPSHRFRSDQRVAPAR